MDIVDRFFGGSVARFQRLIFVFGFAVPLFLAGVFCSTLARASNVYPTQVAAYKACVDYINTPYNGGTYASKLGYTCVFQAQSTIVATSPDCPGGVSGQGGPYSGRYAYDTNGSGAYPYSYWCVPPDCSVYSSGSSENWSSNTLSGDVRCSDGCMSVFHNTGAINLCMVGGDCVSTGYYTGNGNRCTASTDTGFEQKKPTDMTCDHGGLSCYNPDKGFCATTESGEQICEKVPANGAGGCASGATGATCVGNNTPPPAPSDPPIPKGQAPASSATATGTDSGGTVNNFTQNNYSGTSPGPGPSGTGSDPSGNTQSNQNGSGNSSGPSGTQGTDTSGKCPDGSVPTASGCSGTASDAGCDTPPQCYGDAVLCASFKEQVAIRCNTKAASGSSSGGIGTASDALAAAGVPADGGASSDPSPSGLVSSSDIGSDGFDTSGLGFSHACPASPSFEVLGHSYTLDLTPFCNFASLLGWFVLLVAYLVGLRIVATGKA